MESLERKWEDPKAHCIFCMCFCTAAVGDVRWKECLSTEDGRIGSSTMEAFALLVLENNCKAWLCKNEKTCQDNLLTECDCPPSRKKPAFVNKILDGIEFNLETDASTTVVSDKTNAVCKSTGKKRRDWLEKFCKSDRCKKTDDAILKKASSGSGPEDDNSEVTGDQEEGSIVKERAKKTRKLTRHLREFTGAPSEGERKCKGWSVERMLAFEKHVTTIKKDVEDGKHVAWERACREVMERLKLGP
jgi:hypothetical protein